jgi:hypothetical protein
MSSYPPAEHPLGGGCRRASFGATHMGLHHMGCGSCVESKSAIKFLVLARCRCQGECLRLGLL